MTLAQRPGEDDLAEAALQLARLEYPALRDRGDAAQLQALVDRTSAFVQASAAPGDVLGHVQHLGQFLFDSEGFTGNLGDYDDPRNSFLNDVLVRRTGIPITLSIIYMHVGRRVGLWLEGRQLPGAFPGALQGHARRRRADRGPDPRSRSTAASCSPSATARAC